MKERERKKGFSLHLARCLDGAGALDEEEFHGENKFAGLTETYMPVLEEVGLYTALVVGGSSHPSLCEREGESKRKKKKKDGEEKRLEQRRKKKTLQAESSSSPLQSHFARYLECV